MPESPAWWGHSGHTGGAWHPRSQPASDTHVLCGPGSSCVLLCAWPPLCWEPQGGLSPSPASSCPVPGPRGTPGPAPSPRGGRPGLGARAAHLDNPPTPGTKAHCLATLAGRGRSCAFHPTPCGRWRGLRSIHRGPAPPGTWPGHLRGRRPRQAAAPTLAGPQFPQLRGEGRGRREAGRAGDGSRPPDPAGAQPAGGRESETLLVE